MDEQKPEERTPDVEDLDVPEEDAEDVKGGFLKISGVEGGILRQQAQGRVDLRDQ